MRKEQIEEIIDKDANPGRRFSMKELATAVWPTLEARASVKRTLTELKNSLGISIYKKLSYIILRNAFLIELVNLPKIETTLFRPRWFGQLNGDPRYCSFVECLQIAEDLILELPRWLQRDSNTDALSLCMSDGLLPYEAPIDYTELPQGDARIHRRGNVAWCNDENILRTLKLRKYLLDPATSPDAGFFLRVLDNKIKVKTYLTDRVLTGDHKTNREKRWEAHPNSVHFAFRRTCFGIEYSLVKQICAFEGFPIEDLRQLQEGGILPNPLPPALCPITGDCLGYEDFRDEVLDPIHGKSEFQVGHLNPLKAEAGANCCSGHQSDNISWISADGNRIQGSLTLVEVRSLLHRVGQNYTALGWIQV